MKKILNILSKEDKYRMAMLVLSVAVFLLVLNECNRQPVIVQSQPYKQRIDTLYKYDTIVQVDTKIITKLKIKYDTTRIPILTYPFTATLDTIDPETKDSLYVEFHYPINTFLYDLRRSPLIQEKLIIKQFDTIPLPCPKEHWTETVKTFTWHAALGFIIGYIIGVQ